MPHRAAIVLASLVTLVVPGCERSKQHAGDAGAPALPRYWLVGTTLLDRPDGTPGTHVPGPVLVELERDGRVRGVERSAPAVDGFLPPALLTEPGKGAGLMLYAQRAGDIRRDAPTGPVLGQLHRGALVSVLPGDGAEARIVAAPFADSSPGFVRRDVLGPEPQTPEPMRAHPRVRAVRLPGAPLWLEGKYAFGAMPCLDLWIDPEAGTASQYARGVLLTGQLDDAKGWLWRGASLYENAAWCPARAVSKTAAGLVLATPGTGMGAIVSEAVPAVPPGFSEIRPPDPDPLRDAIDHRRSVFWVRAADQGLACDEWTFASGPARLTRKEPMEDERGKTRPWHPCSYEPSHDGAPARLHLETIQVRGASLMKCDCRYDYALVSAGGEELHMVLRRLPDDAVAYAVGDAERWYLSAAACEAARKRMQEAIESDGASAPYVGLHATIAVLGF